MKNPESSSANKSERGSDYEAATLKLGSELAKWISGIDLETKWPLPFDLELEDIFTQSEIESIVEGKAKDEAETIIRNNHTTLLRNYEKIEQFDNRILDFSELNESELESLYHNKNISESDKSILSCIGIIRSAYKTDFQYQDEKELYKNVLEATEGFYGFGIVDARERLKRENSHFRILTKKEREEFPPDSIENIASAALESFVMNPNYSNSRIVDYDDYLYGIMLDCTKRRIKKQKGGDTIEEKVDSSEFQDRVIESMSWALIDEESRGKDYSKEELKSIIEQSAILRANYKTGHHFPNDAERNGRVRVAWGSYSKSIYGFNYLSQKEPFWKRFTEQVQSNNDEVFSYSHELAKAEMKQWADLIDLAAINDINNNNEIDYESKLNSVTLYIQDALDVKNLDEDGRSRPIEVKRFRPQASKLIKAVKKLFNIPINNDGLPESPDKAFYEHSERSIYLQIESKKGRRLSDSMITTLAHEMWHAKQNELLDEGEDKSRSPIINDDLKVRMYYKNNLAYSDSFSLHLWAVLAGKNRLYLGQIMEREAYALEKLVRANLRQFRNKKRGEKVLGTLKKLLQTNES